MGGGWLGGWVDRERERYGKYKFKGVACSSSVSCNG